MRYYIHTLGCKFNQYESARIDEMLSGAGHFKSDPDAADFFIINSCAVTSEAARKSFQMARHFKRKKPDAKVIFTGCAAHDRESAGFDLVLGNGEKMKILEFMDLNGIFRNRSYHLRDSFGYKVSGIPEHTRAFLSVENGCNWGCAYCAVPHFRGTRVRSKPVKTVVEEASEMIRAGVAEIVVSGVNVALYEDEGVGLGGLLERLTEIDGDFRLRLSSVDPMTVLEFEDLFADPKMCHHLHLSLQSGSDSVLKRMRRPYGSEDILKTAEILRKRDPLFAISTDMIVGFPGETEEEFEETVSLIEEAGITKLHAFRFSPRPGTLASKMPDQIDGKTKSRRLRSLKKTAERLEKDYAFKLRGTNQRILVERVFGEKAEGLDQYYVRHSLKCSAKSGDFIECTV